MTLYGRASQSAGELGASQKDLLKFTDNIAVALRVSGQSASESAGALLQLSQALGDGKVQAEEYNSLLDGGRPILQAVAAGSEGSRRFSLEADEPRQERQGEQQGVLRRLPGRRASAAGEGRSSETTISQHFVRLQNVLIDAAGRFNDFV